MQKSGAEGEKISPVAHMLHDHAFTWFAKHACDVPKKRHALAGPTQFMCGKNAEGRIEGTIAKRQGIKAG